MSAVASITRFDCSGLAEDAAGTAELIEAAADFFVRDGYAILDNVLPRDKVEALRRAFSEHYAWQLENEEGKDALEVGERRHMFSIRFDDRFADHRVFANPFVVALVRKVLEPKAILEAYGCILSLPGAPQQHRHHDGPHLFGTRLSAMLPAYALTVAIPLVDMNENHGSTMLLPGSHRWTEIREGAATVLPVVPQGSCVLWDYRLRHFGTENRSQVARPMLYCTFARPWYKDPVNFRDTPRMRRLDFSPSFVESLPEDIRGLVGHALETTPADGQA